MARTEAMEPTANEQLVKAARGGLLGEVKKLLQSRADLESRSDDGWYRTPLHWAAEVGDIDVVQFLLEKNAEIEAKSSSGQTPLFLAARDIEVAQLLLEKNAQIGATDKDGQTPLSYASGKVFDW